MRTIAEPESSRYLFLVGKVRAFETELFDSGRFRRLIESKEPKRFIKDLSDTKYSEAIEKMKNENSENFILYSRNYLYSVYRHLRSKVKDTAFIDIFMIENDISNFVNFSRGAECKESYCGGIFDIKWAETEKLSGFFKDVKDRIEKLKPGQELSELKYSFIEKAAMDMAAEKYLDKLKSRALKEYRRYYIDTKNLLLNKAFEDNEDYINGGNIDINFWKSVNVNDGIPRKISAQPYMEQLKAADDFKMWEPEIRKYLSGLLKDMKKNTFGPEAIVAYILSVKEEIKNLNLIYTGLGIGLSPETIKNNLNTAYV